jgi:hypothetical protein
MPPQARRAIRVGISGEVLKVGRWLGLLLEKICGALSGESLLHLQNAASSADSPQLPNNRLNLGGWSCFFDFESTFLYRQSILAVEAKWIVDDKAR